MALAVLGVLFLCATCIECKVKKLPEVKARREEACKDESVIVAAVSGSKFFLG